MVPNKDFCSQSLRVVLFCLILNILFSSVNPSAVYTYAGTGQCTQDNVSPNDATFKYPRSLWISPNSGDIYIADTSDFRIRVLNRTTGQVNFFAGTGNNYFTGDDIPATSAGLTGFRSLYGDTNDNIYIASTSHHVIRKIDHQTRIISRYAGTTQTSGSSGDGGSRLLATLNGPRFLFVWNGQSTPYSGNIMFISDSLNCKLRYVNMDTDVIYRLMGSGSCAAMTDGTSPLLATFGYLQSIWVSQTGDVYVFDATYYKIYKYHTGTGQVTNFFGSGATDYASSNVDVNSFYPTEFGMGYCECLTGSDDLGTILIMHDQNSRLISVDLSYTFYGAVNYQAGIEGFYYTYQGDNIYYQSAMLSKSRGCVLNWDFLHYDWFGLYYSDIDLLRIRRVDPYIQNTVDLAAGNGTFCKEQSTNVEATSARLDAYGMWMDDSQNVYFSQALDNVVRKVDAYTKTITTVAGDGKINNVQTNCAGTSTSLYYPMGLHGSGVLGFLFIAEFNGGRVRLLETGSGYISTVIGFAGCSYTDSGDNGPASSAYICSPRNVFFHEDTYTLYIVESGGAGHRVRYVDMGTMYIYTIAGVIGQSGYNGDGISGISAWLYYPSDVWVSSDYDVYIADNSNARVRKVSFMTSLISTVAGTGTFGYSGDNGPASSANLNAASGLCADTDGNIYITGSPIARLRKVNLYTGIISLVAGDGLLTYSYNGEGVPPTSAVLGNTMDCHVDSASGNLYFTQVITNRIRYITLLAPTSQPTGQPSFQPSMQPSRQPSSQPSGQPSRQPSSFPTSQPSRQPTRQPSSRPSAQPSRQPFSRPSAQPSRQPSCRPSCQPTQQPVTRPSSQPSRKPTTRPSSQPTRQPTFQPSNKPSCQPTRQPTCQPTRVPSCQPSRQPTAQPQNKPSSQPSAQPSQQPSAQPTVQPSYQPTGQPTAQPTCYPLTKPTGQPSTQPTLQPSSQPVGRPSSQPTTQPTTQPLSRPSSQPSRHPSAQPSNQPTLQPIARPSNQPTDQPSRQPSAHPTSQPSRQPSSQPTGQPSYQPSAHPSRQPSTQPTSQPQSRPSCQPTAQPTNQPSQQPTAHPSNQPSTPPTSQPLGRPTAQPTNQPSQQPQARPSGQPTEKPSNQPSEQPSAQPSRQPTSQPSIQPSVVPSAQPSLQPSGQPISKPSSQPSSQPSILPSHQPTASPTPQPSLQPTSQPQARPSSQPTSYPSSQPSRQPSFQPQSKPSSQPTAVPSRQPSSSPTNQPSSQPSSHPTVQPSKQPSSQPSMQPSNQPSSFPTRKPSSQPSQHPSSQPTHQPTSQPTRQPSNSPTRQPSSQPTKQPRAQPSAQPTVHPSTQPSHSPSSQPSAFPTSSPTHVPSNQPTRQPTGQPTSSPTMQPTSSPSSQPSNQPAGRPTSQPSACPSTIPSANPTSLPTTVPTSQPSVVPSGKPSMQPSSQPTSSPTTNPTSQPSSLPTGIPSCQPSASPTSEPSSLPSSQPSNSPTVVPTSQPSSEPSSIPSGLPSSFPSSKPTYVPTGQPTAIPSSQPSTIPSSDPTGAPSMQPSSAPSNQPSSCPTVLPTNQPSRKPSRQPSSQPSRRPSRQPTRQPTSQPTRQPSRQPTRQPSAQPSGSPTYHPSTQPTTQPTNVPSVVPSTQPSISPSTQPTATPSAIPSSQPSDSPSGKPSAQPSRHPTHAPTPLPTHAPTFKPTAYPTFVPTASPTHIPTATPSRVPTEFPTYAPTRFPTAKPTLLPTAVPSYCPTIAPTYLPSHFPSSAPSRSPRSHPSGQPTNVPSAQPSWSPKGFPTRQPTARPSSQPTTSPTNLPTSQPSILPTTQPTTTPTDEPSAQPSKQPAGRPSSQPTCEPSSQPSSQPKNSPTSQPIAQPRSQPTSQPSQVPTGQPSQQPIGKPTGQPTQVPFAHPTSNPSLAPVMAPPPAAPRVRGFWIQPSNTSIEIRLSLTSDGIVYIGIFEQSPTITPNRQLIVLQNHQSITSNGNVTTTITSLTPVTSYAIYVVTKVSNMDLWSNDTEIMNTKRVFLTKCCKPISVYVSSTLLLQDTPILNWLTLSLSSAFPTSRGNLATTLTLRSTNESSNLMPYQIVPSTWNISSSDVSTTGATKSVAIQGLPSGNYTLGLALSGALSPMYRTTWIVNNGQQTIEDVSGTYQLLIQVVSTDKPLPAPRFVSAAFANDGSYLDVLYSSNTDLGGSFNFTLSKSFSCDRLFSFNCANVSSCAWQNSKTLRIIPSTATNCLFVGHIVRLRSNSRIRAACPTTTCTSWPYVDSLTESVVVTASSSPITPTIVISAPETIAECSSLLIDTSTSTGNAGRAWKASSIIASLSGTTSTALISDLTDFLKQNYTFFPPTSIPASMLQGGESYMFTITLCNVFDKCSMNQKQVYVSKEEVVSVLISGQSSRSISRSTALTLIASGSVTSCSSSSKKSALSYYWNVTNSDGKSIDIVSGSKDPARFVIPTFSLTANTFYTFTVTATTGIRLTTSSVQVYVTSGNVVPVITGGVATIRSLRLGTRLQLDASNSYDEDTIGSKGSTSLRYMWSCSQIKPSIKEDCSDSFRIDDGTSSVLSGLALMTASSDAILIITLTVYDSSSKRSAATSVNVQLIQPLAPSVDIAQLSPSGSKKLNVEDSVKFMGTITVPSYLSGRSSWSLDYESALQTKAVTSIETTFRPPSVGNLTTFNVYLALNPNVLSVGTSYVFRLSCQLIAEDGSSGAIGSNVITLVTNRSPLPGIFTISPRSGQELLQTFTFVSSQWLDEDVPLTYQYSYISSMGNTVTMRSRSESALATSVLPGSQKGYVVCQVDVFDSYLAKNTAVDSVTVTLLDISSDNDDNSTTSSTTALLTSMIDDFASLTNLDDKKQGVAISSYLLNKVDCSQASSEYCQSLNREDCALTSNTCGQCLTTDDSSIDLVLVGEDGDSNEPCRWISMSDDARRHRKLDTSENTNKTCLNDCSSHGTCQYFDVFSNQLVGSCSIDSLSCYAACICETDYVGKLDCSMSQAIYATKLSQRDQIFSHILDVINQEDVSKESIIAWLTAIKEVLGSKDELSEQTILNALTVVHSILEVVNSTSLLSYYDSADVIIPVIDSITQARLLLYSSSADMSEEAVLAMSQIDQSLQLFVDIVSRNIAPGQDTVHVLSDNMKIAVSSIVCGDLVNDTAIMLKQSSREKLLKRSTPTLSLSSKATCGDSNFVSTDAAMTSVVSFSSRLLNTSSASVLADPIKVTVSSLPSSCTQSHSGGCFVTVSFDRKIDDSGMIDDDAESRLETAIITCEEDNPQDEVPFHCGSDTYTVSCNGSSYIQHIQCPKVEIVPTCGGLSNVNDLSGIDTSNCKMINYTSSSVTCQCLLIGSVPARRLSNSNSTSVNDEYSVTYVSLMYAMMSNIRVTFISAGSLNTTKIAKGWQALATLSTIIILFLLGAGYSNYLDDKILHQIVDEKPVDTGLSPVAKDIKAKIQQKRKDSNRDSIRLSHLLSFLGPSTAAGSETAPTQQMARRKRYSPASPEGLMKLSEEALPIAINPSYSLKERIIMEMKKHHRWAGVVFHFSKKFPRTLRVLALATNILSMLFIQSLTYGLTKGDDGSCASYSTEATCLEPRSAFATGDPKCSWSFDQSPHCQFITADGQETIIVFVAVFSALLSTPIAIISTVLIQQVLAAPTITIKQKVAAPKISVMPSLDTIPSEDVAAEGATDAVVATGENTNANGMRRSRRNRLTARNMKELVAGLPGRSSNASNKSGGEGAMTAHTNYRLVAQKDLRRMTQQLFAYRNSIPDSHDKHEFDAVWGIDPITGRFADKQEYSNVILKLATAKIRNMIGVTAMDSIEELLRFDLERLARDYDREKEMFGTESNMDSLVVNAGAISGDLLNSERAKNKRLLFLFQRDLLPGITGHILESKDHRDQIVVHGVTQNAKIAAWCALLAMNSLMATYVFLFAVNQTVENQRAWTRSFLMWIVIEIVVVSSVTVLITHIAIPSLVLQDVVKIRQHLSESINKYYEHLNEQEQQRQQQQQSTVGGRVGAIVRMSMRMVGGKPLLDRPSSDMTTSSEVTTFNTAEYLFLSYRLAQLYPDLKVAKVIQEFSTPWPKQSYRNVVDVSKQYTKKFSALWKSIWMVAMFFLASILVIPTPIQDMILQMLTVIFVGYVLYVHVQLWKIYPALVVVPGLVVLAILHFAYNATRKHPIDENIEKEKNKANEPVVRVSLVNEKKIVKANPLMDVNSKGVGFDEREEDEEEEDDEDDDNHKEECDKVVHEEKENHREGSHDSQSDIDDVSFESFHISIGESAFGDAIYSSGDGSGSGSRSGSGYDSRDGSDYDSRDDDEDHSDSAHGTDRSHEHSSEHSQTVSKRDAARAHATKIGSNILLAAISNVAKPSKTINHANTSLEPVTEAVVPFDSASDTASEQENVIVRKREPVLISRRASVHRGIEALKQARLAIGDGLLEEGDGDDDEDGDHEKHDDEKERDDVEVIIADSEMNLESPRNQSSSLVNAASAVVTSAFSVAKHHINFTSTQQSRTTNETNVSFKD